MNKPQFTQKQLNDWRIYEAIREGGRYNMLFPQARAATGLSKEEYAFVIKHYTELKQAVEGDKP